MRCRPSEVDEETYEDQTLYMSYLRVEARVQRREKEQAQRQAERARGRR